MQVMRETSEQVNERLLDVAAAVFARYGFAKASVQAIADASGYSKAAILKRFTSKEGLQDRVVAQARRNIESLLEMRRAATAAGATRDHMHGEEDWDRATLRAVVQLIRAHPGSGALWLSAFSLRRDEDDMRQMQPALAALLTIFGGDDNANPADRLRVVAALGAISVAALATRERPSDENDSAIVDLGLATLGYCVQTEVDTPQAVPGTQKS
jgi:AcrR family transcriptional regulator